MSEWRVYHAAVDEWVLSSCGRDIWSISDEFLSRKREAAAAAILVDGVYGVSFPTENTICVSTDCHDARLAARRVIVDVLAGEINVGAYIYPIQVGP